MTEPARATRSNAFKRAIVVAATALLAASGALVSGSPPAHADSLNVTHQSALRVAFSAASPGLVRLGDSFEVTGVNLTVSGDATLDLNGHVLTTKNIIVNPNVTLTITDDSAAGTGQLKVTTGATEGAGIQTTDATLIVNGGHIQITARGGAGIGGRNSVEGEQYAQNGGRTIINDGVVEVESRDSLKMGAAGIGGGSGALPPGSEACCLMAGGGNGGYTEINGGTVTVVGAFGAGIGGGAGGAKVGSVGMPGGAGGTTVITGGTVTAFGRHGAGIGGGEGGVFGMGTHQVAAMQGGNGGSFYMYGGEVSAVGARGAGIGGGSGGDVVHNGPRAGGGGDGGTATISGGHLTAVGGRGAGIGGGDTGTHESSIDPAWYGEGGAAAVVTVGVGAVVQASRSGSNQSAIGPGEAHEDVYPRPVVRNVNYRPMVIDGSLLLPSSETIMVRGHTPISGSGLITGVDGAGGTIINHGTVTTQVNLDQVDVTHHNFPVTFEPAEATGLPAAVVNVFATTFEAGARSFPDFTSSGSVLTAWNHSADGTGDVFTADTTLSGALTVYGQWEDLEYGMDPSATATTVGTPVTFTIEALGGAPAGDLSNEFTFTTNGGEPEISDNSVTFTRPGSWMVTATHDVTGEILTADINAALDPSNPDIIELALTAADVFAGESVTATVTGVDAYSNDLGDLTDLAIFDTGNPSDAVVDNDITLGDWGPRTVSATVGSASDAQSLNVWPEAADYMLTATPEAAVVGEEIVFAVSVGPDATDVTDNFSFIADGGEPSAVGDAMAFTRPGEWTLTATHDVTGEKVSTTVEISLDLTNPETIGLTLSESDVLSGDTVTATVTGTDLYGNDLGDLTDLAVFDTGEASDVAAAGEISLGHWGPRTVIASVGSASDDQPLMVWPAASDYTLTASPDSLLVGDDVQLTVMLGGESGADVTSEFTFATAAAGAAVDGDAAMFTQPGTHTVVATHTDTGVEVEIDVSVTVDRTSPADITLSLSATTVNEGESLSFGVTGTDHFGNDLGDLSDLATVSSSHATDIIDPAGSIHFPTASEHTITAVVGQVSASVVVTVIPAVVPVPDEEPMPDEDPAPEGDPDSGPDTGTTPGEGDTAGASGGQPGLPATGVENVVWVGVAFALLIIGAGAALIVRRKHASGDRTHT